MSLVDRSVHTRSKRSRKWDQDYIQIVAVDPGKVNLAFRIERRYHNGLIQGLVFWKAAFGNNVYQKIFHELEEYADEYLNTHVFLIEKQPPRNMTINRIMQHVITYFSCKTKDYPLLPDVFEVSPHLKGSQLRAPADENLKKWASRKARVLLEKRKDNFSLEVMDYWLDKQHPKGQRKDDDLADTIVMIEAYCKFKGYSLTKSRSKIRVTIKKEGYLKNVDQSRNFRS